MRENKHSYQVHISHMTLGSACSAAYGIAHHLLFMFPFMTRTMRSPPGYDPARICTEAPRSSVPQSTVTLDTGSKTSTEAGPQSNGAPLHNAAAPYPDQLQPVNSNSLNKTKHTPFCAAAAEADRKVELLGTGVINPLEDRVADLEGLQLERRVDTLYQRLKPYEDYRTLVEHSVLQLREVEERVRKQQTKVDTVVKVEVDRQADVIRALNSRIQQVEQAAKIRDRQTTAGALEVKITQQQSEIKALTMRLQQLEDQLGADDGQADKLAVDLLSRLQEGDVLRSTLSAQLLSMLKARSSSSSLSGSRTASPANGVKKSTKRQTPDQRSLSKRLGHSRKAAKDARGATAEDVRNAMAEAGRGVSSDSARTSSSLSTVQSGFETPTEETYGSKSRKAPTARMSETEVPETQQQDDEDVDMDDDDDQPFIPGERRSGRTPKPRRFADQVPWQQASKMVRGLNSGPTGRDSS